MEFMVQSTQIVRDFPSSFQIRRALCNEKPKPVSLQLLDEVN